MVRDRVTKRQNIEQTRMQVFQEAQSLKELARSLQAKNLLEEIERIEGSISKAQFNKKYPRDFLLREWQTLGKIEDELHKIFDEIQGKRLNKIRSSKMLFYISFGIFKFFVFCGYYISGIPSHLLDKYPVFYYTCGVIAWVGIMLVFRIYYDILLRICVKIKDRQKTFSLNVCFLALFTAFISLTGNTLGRMLSPNVTLSTFNILTILVQFFNSTPITAFVAAIAFIAVVYDLLKRLFRYFNKA